MENGKPPKDAEKQHKKPAEETAAPPKKKRHPLLWGMAAFLLLDALAAGWWFCFSPQAQVQRAVKKMAAAFEQKDLPGVMEAVSGNYSDPAGNTKEGIESFMRLMLKNIDKAKIDITKMKGNIRKGVAYVSVEGRITYRIKGYPQKTDYNKDDPFLMEMIREGGVWRVISMPMVSESLNDFQGDIKEIENF